MLINVGGNNDSTGYLQINVTNQINVPVENATVIIRESEGQGAEEVQTDSSGQTEKIALGAPVISYSLDENSEERPYAKYDVEIEAEGYETEIIKGAEILPTITAINSVRLRPTGENPEEITVPEHTLYGTYPDKISEDEIKNINNPGEIVLSRVVVPETVVVHDGRPTSNAKNYYVSFKDYIKNVASSEIYSTWPTATIEANVLAILSFTLNRVYTEWYRNKGYEFTITSSTAYDHKWSYGRTIYEPISRVVDRIFNQYVSRPNIKQPLLTQYCDGKKVTCPNWLSQWGSCELGKQGLSAIEILRRYYGNDVYINSAEQISGIPSSWPGSNLDVGSRGQKVMQMQEQLDTIAQVYSAIPRLTADGIFGEKTQKSVKAFQKVFNLPQSGIVDFATWYKISQIYVGITRIGEGM